MSGSLRGRFWRFVSLSSCNGSGAYSFCANASHELRTPLTFLCANTEILLEERDRLSADDVLLLEDIQTEAVHMAALAQSMLTLARLDAGDLKLHREHDILDLTTLAESVVRQGRALA